MKVFEHDWELGPTDHMVILTGAGISADSGVRTFRASDGLWENHRVEDVATPEAFDRDPKLVIDFYNARRAQLPTVEPNAAHNALAKLQKTLGSRCYLITQNVDNLHERGGSPQVCHMHGSLSELKCHDCSAPTIPIDNDQPYDQTCTECGGPMRPDIVWFGEMPYFMDAIQSHLTRCTHFVYIGTSSQVYPAAGFKDIARRNGAEVLAINLDVDKLDPHTHRYLEGKAKDCVPEFVESLTTNSAN